MLGVCRYLNLRCLVDELRLWLISKCPAEENGSHLRVIGPGRQGDATKRGEIDLRSGPPLA